VRQFVEQFAGKTQEVGFERGVHERGDEDGRVREAELDDERMDGFEVVWGVEW